MSQLLDSLRNNRIVPLVQSNDSTTALKISEALLKGGLDVLEIVLRTDKALDCLEAIVKEFPQAHVGAGTVLNADQTQEVIRRGAGFIVSPGLDLSSIKVARAAGVSILPGIATATELQEAFNLGLNTVKLFPASLVGGPKILKAFSSVFGGIQFMPTGGVNPDNLLEYLSIPSVLACGGSWLTPKDAVESKNYDTITRLAAEAIELSKVR